MALIGRPYTKEIKASTIKDVTKKMASFKGNRGLHASEFKKICEASPEIKNNPNLSRIASNIVKSMKGSGPRDISTQTWRGKQFIEAYGQALKKIGKENTSIKTTRFGRKATTQDPTNIFQKSVVEEQIKKNKPIGPSKKELAGQAKEISPENIRYYQYGRQKEIYGDKDALAVARGETDKPTEQVNVSSPEKRTDNAVHFARGTSLPKSKGVDTGTSFVGTFGQDDNNQEDTSKNISTGKVTDINKYREEKEKNKNNKKNAENLGKFGKDIEDSFDIDKIDKKAA